MKPLKAIIPWLPHPSRLAGLDWVYEWYWALTGEEPYLSEAPKGKVFNKAKAINKAAKLFPGCTLVIGDADCLTCNKAFRAGVVRVQKNPRSFCLPHTSFKPMLRNQSKWFLATQKPSDGVNGRLFPRRSQKRPAPGGIWIIDAGLLLQNPVNEGFVGWGYEDGEYLTRVPYTRVGGPLFHIYHTPASRAFRGRNRRFKNRLNKRRPKA